MRTNYNLQKAKDIAQKEDKDTLLNYINEEFLNIKEYKTLIEDISIEKKDILEIFYNLLNLINNDSNKFNSIVITEQLIKQANNQGFTWPNSNSCFNKIEEEFLELKDAINRNDVDNIKEEIGDLIFTLHCYTNIKKINFEQILINANTKFEKRFKKLLEIAKSKNIDLTNSSPDIKEDLWKIAKKSL